MIKPGEGKDVMGKIWYNICNIGNIYQGIWTILPFGSSGYPTLWVRGIVEYCNHDCSSRGSEHVFIQRNRNDSTKYIEEVT